MLLEMERFFFKHLLLKIIEKEEKDRGRDKTDIYRTEADIERSYSSLLAWLSCTWGRDLGFAKEKELITKCRVNEYSIS